MTRPRPVLTSSAIAGALTGVALVLTFLGYADAANKLSGESQAIGAAIAFLVGLLPHLAAGAAAQAKATPLADPVDATGAKLMTAAAWQADLAAKTAAGQVLDASPVMATLQAGPALATKDDLMDLADAVHGTVTTALAAALPDVSTAEASTADDGDLPPDTISGTDGPITAAQADQATAAP